MEIMPLTPVSQVGDLSTSSFHTWVLSLYLVREIGEEHKCWSSFIIKSIAFKSRISISIHHSNLTLLSFHFFLSYMSLWGLFHKWEKNLAMLLQTSHKWFLFFCKTPYVKLSPLHWNCFVVLKLFSIALLFLSRHSPFFILLEKVFFFKIIIIILGYLLM